MVALQRRGGEVRNIYKTLAWEPSFALKLRFLYKIKFRTFKPSWEHTRGSTEFLN